VLSALLVIGGLVAVVFIWRRMRADGADGVPASLRAAARRLDFATRPDAPAISSIHTPEICIAAMAVAFARMDAASEIPAELVAAGLQKRLGVEPAEGADLAALGGWLVTQSGGPTPAFQQLTKRLKQLAHGAEFDKLMRLLGDVTAAGTKGMPSPAQADALGALARVFRTA